MSTIRKIVSILLWLTSIPFFIREIVQRRKITILIYHDIKVDTADKHFRVLKSKYNIISLREFLDAKHSGDTNTLPIKSLIITIDDGHKDNFRLTPLFDKYKIPVTIFVCSGIVGTNRHFWFQHSKNIKSNKLKQIPNRKRLEVLKNEGFDEESDYRDRQALSKDEIMNMQFLVNFQSHTIFHPILPRCNMKESRYEIANSKKDLENTYGLNIYALCYPNGDYSERELSLVEEAGYECGLTADLGFNSKDTDIFRLSRIGVRDDSDIHELLVRASGLWSFLVHIITKTRFASPYYRINKRKLS